ncbi:MAG: hypothetical protein AB7H48_04850 [Parachlamydiales bacterium]
MKKSTVLKTTGIIILIGVLYWNLSPYSESLNNIAIESAEKGAAPGNDGTTNTNASALESETDLITEQQLNTTNNKDNNQLRQQVNSMTAEQASEAFRDLGLALWNLLLKPMLFLSFLVGIPVWLFQSIRRNFKQKKKFSEHFQLKPNEQEKKNLKQFKI